jgi:DnaK suppressor protein
MNTTELSFFKEVLIQQRSSILNTADVFKEESLQDKDSHGDEGDQAVNELNLTLSLRLHERQAQLLEKIDRALSKIDAGNFGLCEQCEEPLHFNRLKARPVATLCIACKEEQERTERVFA